MKRFILCCVSHRPLNEAFVQEVQNLITTSGAHCQEPEFLTENSLQAFDLLCGIPGDPKELKIKLLEVSNKYQVDMALIPEEGRHERKLIVFDMDSTLIQHEVIDEMALLAGVGEKVQGITERAMNGELNFDQSLTERVALVKGLTKSDMEKICSSLKLTPGVRTLIREVKKKGYKTAIISGGFKYFAEHFQQELDMDYAFANDLEWDGERLSGRVKGKIINAEEKARLVEELAAREKITLNQVVAVGDGANDLLMLAKAGFGVAFHAKEKVRKEASYRLSYGNMTTLLHFLGIPGNHLDEVI